VENLLEGTTEDEYIAEEAYVLGNVDGVGLYKAEMTDGVWLNNANRAYLPASVASGAASYSFRFPGTTAIEEVKGENGEAKVVYDLNGRRVQTAPVGKVYIQDGVKKFNK
jgi:hypothetical protein